MCEFEVPLTEFFNQHVIAPVETSSHHRIDSISVSRSKEVDPVLIRRRMDSFDVLLNPAEKVLGTIS